MPFIVVYIDNIWIITPDDNIQMHYQQVMATIARCTAMKVRLNLKKPVLCKRKFIGLGHLISHEGIELDPHKVQSALGWEQDTLETPAQMRSFLGSVNYLRNNIRHYSELVVPLYAVTTAPDKSKIQWTKPLRQSLQIFKNAIGTAPIINHVDPLLPFSVATDASHVGVGSILFQPRVSGEMPNEHNIVSFNSRALHKSERGYAAYKLEFLSIIVALRRYHDFIWGTHFQLYTDHQA